MAKKTTAKTADIKDKIVKAALELAAAQGWDITTLGDIAAKAGLSLAELHDQIEDKTDILALLGRQIDRKVLAAMGEADPAISPRDRLFDILMERYDILGEYRSGLVPILETFRCDPKQVVIAAPHLCRSMSWMLEAAGIDTNGWRGALKVAGLTALYLKVLRVWMRDENRDLSKTMAALDRDLSRAERAANSFGF